MNILDETIKERTSIHGNFAEVAEVSQILKDVLLEYSRDKPNAGWYGLNAMQKEALSMILHKISRIICGDPNVKDHWLDLSGYSMLVVKDLERRGY